MCTSRTGLGERLQFSYIDALICQWLCHAQPICNGEPTLKCMYGAISTTYGKSKSLINSTTTGDAWLTAMNDAAVDLNMTIQYSMSFSPAIMQSSKLPAVTQIRGSGDYTVGGNQWRVGLTSMFYWALGAVASKDTLWTTENQPGCPKVFSIFTPQNRLEHLLLSALQRYLPALVGDQRLGPSTAASQIWPFR